MLFGEVLVLQRLDLGLKLLGLLGCGVRLDAEGVHFLLRAVSDAIAFKLYSEMYLREER